MPNRAPWARLFIVALAVAIANGCSAKNGSHGANAAGSGAGNDGGGSNQGGSGPGTGSVNGSGGDGALGSTTDPNWMIPKELQLCDGPCQCADGIDNDGDGTADGFDTECTGPGDNDEGTFATGIPGDNVDPKWQDCFFDGNSGGGDDGCRYSTKCLTGELPQTDKDCTLSQNCIDFCAQRTPNGCDCFGCCEVHQDDGSVVHIVLTAGCDVDHLDTCTSCTPTTQCGNECGKCELCAGKSPDDLLAADCGVTPPQGGAGQGGTTGGGAGTTGSGGTTGGGAGTTGSGGTTGGGSTPPPYVCDNGEDVCTSTSGCKTGYYCAFGCCIVLPPQ